MFERIRNRLRDEYRVREQRKDMKRIMELIESMKLLRMLVRESGISRTERRKLFKWVWANKK